MMKRYLGMIVIAMAQGVVAQQQPPKFQSSVDVTPIDVSVVDDRGQPIQHLTPADFNVRIDGNPRRVVSAEWVSLAPEPKGATVEVRRLAHPDTPVPHHQALEAAGIPDAARIAEALRELVRY